MNQRVYDFFSLYGKQDDIIELDESSATVALAAHALGCEEKDIAKTMAFLTPEPILIVVAGDVKIDNAKYRHTFNTKAKMIPGDILYEMTGFEVGGVCPFNPKEHVKVYLDESLKKLEYCYPACGSHNNAIKVSLKELEEYSHFEKWVDVTKPMI